MKIYQVGGAVRDMLLNKTPHDFDYLVVGSTVEEMLTKGFQQVGVGTCGDDHFPLVHIHHFPRLVHLARKIKILFVPVQKHRVKSIERYRSLGFLSVHQNFTVNFVRFHIKIILINQKGLS